MCVLRCPHVISIKTALRLLCHYFLWGECAAHVGGTLALHTTRNCHQVLRSKFKLFKLCSRLVLTFQRATNEITDVCDVARSLSVFKQEKMAAFSYCF